MCVPVHPYQDGMKFDFFFVYLSFSEGQKYPGVAPVFFFRGMTPHGCDTRGKKCQTGGIPGAKNAFGVTFLAKKKAINVTFLYWQEYQKCQHGYRCGQNLQVNGSDPIYSVVILPKVK